MAIPAGTVYLDVMPNMATLPAAISAGATKGATASKLKGTMGTVGKFMGAALVASFAKSSFQDFEEAEAVTRSLTNRIAEMGQEGRPTAASLLETNDALAKMSGIDDELISKGTTLLATFGNIRNEVGQGNDIFSRANSLMVDYAAQFTGGNMEGAATQLGKALDDPVRGMTALRRVGVSFTDQETKMVEKMVAANNTLGAQKLILEAIQPQVEGAAAASATMGDKASVAFGNFKEAVGSLVAQGMGPLMAIVTPFLHFLAANPPLIAAVVAALTTLIVGTKLYAAWQQRAIILQKLMWLSNPWVLIGAAVVALVLLIIANWDKVKKYILPLWNALKAAGIAVWNAIKAVGLALWRALSAAVRLYFNVYKAIFTAVWTVAKAAWDRIKSAFQTLKSFLIAGWNAIKDVGTGIWDAIKGAAISVFNAIASAWNNTMGRLSFSIPGWVPGIGGNSFDVPDIPYASAAMGGLVTRGGLVNVHSGELISPIEKVMGRAGGGGVLQGELTLTPDGTAFIRGVIVDELDADHAFATRIERQQ